MPRRKRLANGIDPMANRIAEKTATVVATKHTFEKVAEEWLEHWHGNKSARHAAMTKNRLKANVYPILGARPISEVEPMELVQLAKQIESRGASDMAKRILQIVGMVFRCAVAHMRERIASKSCRIIVGCAEVPFAISVEMLFEPIR